MSNRLAVLGCSDFFGSTGFGASLAGFFASTFAGSLFACGFDLASALCLFGRLGHLFLRRF
jgi:hypothetical protein